MVSQMAHAKKLGEPFMAHLENLYNILCKVETEMHVLLECKLYERERNTWLEVLEQLAEGVNGSKLERMKGCMVK